MTGVQTCALPISISELKARHIIKKNKKGNSSLKLWIDHPKKMLTAILIGNNIANVFASVYATVIAQKIIGNSVVAIAGGIMTLLILIFGEITPKTFAKQHANIIAPIAARLLKPFYYIFYPITMVLRYIAKNMTFESQIGNKTGLLTEDELEFMVEMGKNEGVLNADKHKMIKNIFDMGDTIAREIMTPRPDIKAADASMSVEEVIKLFAKYGHSRMPVYEDSRDNILGIINLRDLIAQYPDIKNDNVKKHMKDAVFVPETKSIFKLLKEMQNKKIHLVIVLDEYGGTSGITTVEDIIEEIVGEIEDEDDSVKIDVRKVKDGSYIINSRMSFDDFVEKFNLEEFEDIERTDFDTVGGFIMYLDDSIPKIGAVIKYKNLRFTVLDADANRLLKVKLEIVKE